MGLFFDVMSAARPQTTSRGRPSMKKTLRTPRSIRRARLHTPHLERLEPRQLLSGSPVFTPTWFIHGDADKAHPNDTIVVAYNPTTQNFDLTINGTLVTSRPASKVRTIVINAGQGDDTVTLDTGTQKVRTI